MTHKGRDAGEVAGRPSICVFLHEERFLNGESQLLKVVNFLPLLLPLTNTALGRYRFLLSEQNYSPFSPGVLAFNCFLPFLFWSDLTRVEALLVTPQPDFSVVLTTPLVVLVDSED
jgi:hypothetical protein